MAEAATKEKEAQTVAVAEFTRLAATYCDAANDASGPLYSVNAHERAARTKERLVGFYMKLPKRIRDVLKERR